ncbi:MAG: translation elongation factor Ts [Myxococcota bacterium]
MAKISASMVKALRDQTGAGMMDCKKALKETDGDLEAAADFLRKKGIAKAGKKAGRTAAEGLVAVATADDNTSATLIEINCETDFVARNEAFQGFVQEIVTLAHTNGITDIEQLDALDVGGKTVAERTKEQIANIGENIQLRRLSRLSSDFVGYYIHAGSQIGVLVQVKLDGADAATAEEFARNVAMHVAASNPSYTRTEDIDSEKLDKEREILTAQALDSGKPANIVEKMVEGRLRKWKAEITLMEQPFVRDPDLTVAKYQKKTGGVTLENFVRYQVGEGIEKETTNLADEVAAQLNS